MLLYEIAEALGNALCDCMVVEVDDPDEDVMNAGYACYCETPECCVVVGWGEAIPDVCCGATVVLRNNDYGDQPVSAGPSHCWGPLVATYDLTWDVCPPALDTNDPDVFNDYARFQSAILQRAVECWGCIKTISAGGVTYNILSITAISPTNSGITFAVRVTY